ncbi:aminotransferase class I/II-fold pyridoxal phosphate-dependent enzyme [Klebsiella michiganensis]|uniref:aminotransferase class I/II-fold pyridoxal phosphate-dependent enzyme n=1 Tax=Klebsiella michiganensis TaxID=1134687 RepID=UPI000CD354E4|nr:aminotransferase class I/II-fold pyridoxal phosphate-dependent enzyme [Klebsiella michiganensis]AUW09334.1 aspartate aminotransferase [Klebsiella oxytoca]MBZ7488099.1 aminotransferase class I/II-fold pyridoxal phosphate-dependent enzyme [Klebsiella michiganensis]MDU6584250.1 aminotransferase class I/II-fold pyridoxal phosphate-dependent enzyme [Klebsiella michiganensis]MEB7682920.1 aminotransferase class I/II-fold pyridoxal phosphate-dependent enzyme [Klebsiella michiganensis]PSI97058.1 asp
MTISLSDRVQRVSLSANAAAKQRTNELKRAGVDILDLTTGEPDFDTPDHIKQAAYEAIARGETKYTPTPGIPALREAVQQKLQRENRLEFAVADIIIANGAKQVIFNAFAATLNDGDEVIVPVPYWPTFPDSVRFNGGTPVFIECHLEQGYKLTPEQLAASTTSRTRWLVLNHPGNPSGAVYSTAELQALAAVLRGHPQVLVMLDDLYEQILFDGCEHQNLLNVADDFQARSLLVGGVSKTYAMTGWRIGFGAGPKALITAMTVVQSQISSGASSVSQAAALAAFNGGLDFIAPQVAAYQQRRDVITDILVNIDGLELRVPQGGFFVFCRCAGLIGRYRPDGAKIENEADVLDYLLESGVSGVGGSAYGLSPYFRLSIATDNATVAEAGRRIASACAKLSTAQ